MKCAAFSRGKIERETEEYGHGAHHSNGIEKKRENQIV